MSAADPLTAARAEAQAAEREVERLETAARGARSEADRLRAEQAAAAQAILAAEARLGAAEAEQRALAAVLERRAAQLAERQRPAALLLAGLAQLGRRPPLLTLADGSSAREFVTARALLDTSLPVIRARTAALRGQLAEDRRLAARAEALRIMLAQGRDELQARQRRFAELERQANARFAQLGGDALEAGDAALARSAQAEQLAGQAAAGRSSARLAAELGRWPAAPPRPVPPDSQLLPAPLAWQLPVSGPVRTGLLEVSPAGVRSRGLTFASRRGAAVLAPANGRVAFAGPFRRHDGIVIIDHGRGWMTLLTEVHTGLAVGARVERGAPLGRALGPVTAELTRDGQPQPAALIAGSSALLSNGRNTS
uniref:murein hydrolase activator EnvC family protein n=1 Tax=uncultured Sphingomonas sp. TaxID=158754 RepID=UPI0025D0C539|nr:peptidoglycan DD-metalloendopeptidase family protein [uncultured Sphingomonas sp.]